MAENLVLYHEKQAETGRSFNPDRFFYRFVRPLLGPPEGGKNRLVDLGCGAGELSVHARDLGYSVFAVDVSEANVRNLQSLGFEAKVTDLNRPIDLPDNSFDF